MIYNILIIDELTKGGLYTKYLKCLDDYQLCYVSKKDELLENLTNNNIHIVIINTHIVTLQELYDDFQNSNIDYKDIPILLFGNSNQDIKDTKLLVYDVISDDITEQLFCNKIKFCQTLYKKELQHENNMQRILYVDGLTKLPNRAKLIQDIIKDEDSINGIAIIDINDFKEINDFYGLKIGDNILKGVVNIIQDTIGFLQDKISLYKFAADVYCLANKGLDHSAFEEMVMYVLGAIDGYIFKEDGNEIDIKATAGITFSSKKNKLITADIALQAAKKSHKDYIVFYEELDTVNEYEKNMMWAKKLKIAMNNDKIVVYYQPLVNNQTLKVDKYECLVRMIDEDGKVISPFFFLEIAKKANQYRNITKIVIDKAFKEFSDKDFEFSVNVSYEDVEDKYFIEYVKSKLNQYKVAKQVTWEILEDESIKDYDLLLDFIKSVKALGCKVSIDDFGSGYSNFEYLLKMDVDYLKIDASLIKNVATDENSYKVVKTVIDFAKNLNLKTISEYVENKDIFEITKQLGSTYSQGYFFSAPIPAPTAVSYKDKI